MEPEREDVVKGSLFRIAFSTISQCPLLFMREENSADPYNSSSCVLHSTFDLLGVPGETG